MAGSLKLPLVRAGMEEDPSASASGSVPKCHKNHGYMQKYAYMQTMLQQHADVVDALHVWWTTMLRSARFSQMVEEKRVIQRDDVATSGSNTTSVLCTYAPPIRNSLLPSRPFCLCVCVCLP